MGAGLLGVGVDELGAGRLRLQELERLCERLGLPGVAKQGEDEAERGQAAAGGELVALFALLGEGLLEGVLGFA